MHHNHLLITTLMLPLYAYGMNQIEMKQKIASQTEQEIKSLDDDVSVQTYKIIAQDGESIDVSRTLLEHSGFFRALFNDKETHEIHIPATSGIMYAQLYAHGFDSRVCFQDITLILQAIDTIISQPWGKKVHEIIAKIDTIEKSDASVEIIEKDVQALFALPGIEEEIEKGLSAWPLTASDLVNVYQIGFNFKIDILKKSCANKGHYWEKINFKLADTKRTWQELKDLKIILRLLGLKRVIDAGKLDLYANERLLQFYMAGQYLDIQPLVEYIKPLVARVVLNHYFDQRYSSIIKKFDPAWEAALNPLIHEDVKKVIETNYSKMTPLHRLRHFNPSLIINLTKFAEKDYLYVYGLHGDEYLWDLSNGCLVHFDRLYRQNLSYKNWSEDNHYFAGPAVYKNNHKIVNVYALDWNLTLEQMAFVKEALTLDPLALRTLTPQVFAGLPETWKQALQPEKTQLIPLKKYKAYLYSFPPFMRKAFYGVVGAIGLGSIWLMMKLKKRA